ncbi:hypothetical protein ABEB36_006750 [Hypothenemus hampei]|uniref:Inositol-pentakisphosphate 2-kinase n=1 Tax=Hypothenemus hampei TaxID=57062 RepID=A0ABD1ERN5_HYPHA
MSLYESTVPNFTMSDKWCYRGEGNNSLVISLPESRHILRIHKIEKPKSIFQWIIQHIVDFIDWYGGKGLRDEIRDFNFYCKLMRPLIGYTYTSESMVLLLSRKQIKIFKDYIDQQRPAYRKKKTLQIGRATLFRDFAFLPRQFDQLEFKGQTYAVEIKPKQGWRAETERHYPECLFCMNQYLKLEKEKIQSRTNYCPEELFSGDKTRMTKTLKNLINEPQNNFRIFKNGSICYDDKQKNTHIFNEIFDSNSSREVLIEEFSNFLQTCLTTVIETNENMLNCQCDICLKFKSDNLPRGSVLDQILSVQKLDQEGTVSIHNKLLEIDKLEDYTFIEKLLVRLCTTNNICSLSLIVNISRSSKNELIFLPYLVSAIAKDCSLMITFQKIEEPVR